MAYWMAVSRDKVSAIPASSMMIRVRRSISVAQPGRSPCLMPQVSLARVSVWMPVCSASTAAAAADGARPMTCPPSSATESFKLPAHDSVMALESRGVGRLRSGRD
jgi:hypothetical protein